MVQSVLRGSDRVTGVVEEMTDLDKRAEYGLGIWDRRYEYGSTSGALGHTVYVWRDTEPLRSASRIRS